MKDIVKQLNDLPFILKLILCIPVLDIVWSVGRVLNALAKKNLVWTIIGVLTIFPGAAFMWLVDIILVIMRGKAFAMA
ncbi:MAG: hypothetical protein II368_02670 [Clostridia bacterium]|nr:hypothetical protein [Clostridia bacterium]